MSANQDSTASFKKKSKKQQNGPLVSTHRLHKFLFVVNIWHPIKVIPKRNYTVKPMAIAIRLPLYPLKPETLKPETLEPSAPNLNALSQTQSAATTQALSKGFRV